MDEVLHSIKLVAKRTGLSPHVIRVWERRYNAVSPARTDTNRRSYSEAEIERLNLLRRATDQGHTIGNIANLSSEQLRALCPAPAPQPAAATKPLTHSANDELIATAIGAVQKHDAAGLEDCLARATIQLGFQAMLEHAVAPLACQLGELWSTGKLTAAHEHFASAVIRNFLIRNTQPYAGTNQAPTLIVATPAGQLHELGAVMVAAAANHLGWRVIYLGTSLPALEIVGAAISNQARAVALSIVFPADDPQLSGELAMLRRYLPPETGIIIGGKSASGYQNALEAIQARHTPSLAQFCDHLRHLRTSSRNNPLKTES